MSIAAVILAAGASRRLGRPKQLVELGGETLLARAIRIAHEAGLQPVLVVIADPTLNQLVQHSGATPVLNPDAAEGIASSIRTGVRAAQALHAPGIVLMTCDQVMLGPDHLRQLCAYPETPTASAYAGTVGTPAYLPAVTFPDLLELRGDRGARALLHDARTVMLEALSVDIDTDQDLDHARRLSETGGL